MKLLRKLLSVNPSILVLCALPLLALFVWSGVKGGCGASYSGYPHDVNTQTNGCGVVSVQNPGGQQLHQSFYNLCGFNGWVQVKILSYDCCLNWLPRCSANCDEVQAICGWVASWTSISHSFQCNAGTDIPSLTLIADNNPWCCPTDPGYRYAVYYGVFDDACNQWW